MKTTIDPPIEPPVKRGQAVVAGDEAIGEVLDVLYVNDVHYLHVLRYGSGADELYIPCSAIDRIVANHVYLHFNALDLVGRAWHERPGGSCRKLGS